MASSGVIASVMYRKSIHLTNSSGVMSATILQTGLFNVFAQRSQIALTTAPRAKWMTPFSGPIHLNCESETRYLQVFPQFSTREERVRPLIRSATLSMALQTMSLPRPIVKVYNTSAVSKVLSKYGSGYIPFHVRRNLHRFSRYSTRQNNLQQHS
jgi:hypothetical protein